MDGVATISILLRLEPNANNFYVYTYVYIICTSTLNRVRSENELNSKIGFISLALY